MSTATTAFLGSMSFAIEDHTRKEDARGALDGPRALLVTATYPTRADASSRPRVHCFSRADEGDLNARLRNAPEGAFDTWRGEARVGADLDADAPALPLVLFSHGYNMPLAFYTSWIEGLARSGYLVVGITHPYAAGCTILPSGALAHTEDPPPDSEHRQTVAKLSLDQRAVLASLRNAAQRSPLGQLAARWDGKRVATVGHSMGGAASARSARLDPTVMACAILDGTPDDETTAQGVEKPLFLAVSSRFDEHPSYVQFWNASRGPGYRVELPRAGHNSFTDLPFCLERLGSAVNRDELDIGTIDPARAREATLSLLVAFIDKHLRGLDAPMLEGTSPYPEVIFVRR